MTIYYNQNNSKLEKIVSRCASLYETYRPPWWCIGPWMNALVLLIKQWLAPSLPFHRETITCPDGGEISLDWANDDETKGLPDSAPVIGILHTITGSSRDHFGMMRYAAKRGWRSCVLNRRGHSGMPLRVTTRFSIVGDADDTVLLVDKMRQKFPDNFIGLAGISAGSGQIVSFIGREGDNARIDAAASLCPLWDLTSGCKNLTELHPWVDSVVTKTCIKHFLGKSKHEAALSTMPDVVTFAKQSKTLEEFVDRTAPLSGYDDFDHFTKENDPKHYLSGNTTPCLVLNALDDFLCVKENIRYDVPQKMHNYVLSVTEKGSHIAYNEGFFGTGNYMWRLTLDFFQAVKDC